jgi:hypothetical protein
METFIQTDELYPFFTLIDYEYLNAKCELSADKINFINQAMLDFYKAQGIMREAVKWED